MPYLEYAKRTLPLLVPKDVVAFETSNALFNSIRTSGERMKVTGTKARFFRVKGRHSDASAITEDNITVDLTYVPVEDYSELDWADLIIPLVFPHKDRDRLANGAEYKAWMARRERAALAYHYIQMMMRLFNGTATNAAYNRILSFEGGNTSGLTLGAENGALIFDTPANQVAGGLTYMGTARAYDTTYYTDNWYNQFKAHTGIFMGDFLDVVEELRMMTADQSMEDPTGENQGATLGFLSLANHAKLAKAVRQYPGAGGVSPIVYTPEDIRAGKAMPSVHIVNGVHFRSNRFINDIAIGKTEPAYMIDPTTLTYMVSAGNDHVVVPPTDRLVYGNQAADVGFIKVSIQIGCTNPMRNACTCQ